jgi:hypothetical protein
MKKVCLVLVTLVMLCGFFITTGEAGQLCWQVDSTNDILDGYVSVVASGGKSTRAVHGAFYTQGSSPIYWPIAGNMVKIPDGSYWLLQLNTTFISGYLGLVATLDPSTLSGSGAYTGVGDTVSTYATTFTKISCKELPPYVAP